MNTLLVEPDERQRRIMCELLASRGHRVSEFSDFGTASGALDRGPAQLALVAWNEQAGRWVERANAHPNGARMLVVALLASEQCAHLDEILKSGANDFLLRPFDRPEHRLRILQFEHRLRGWARLLETRGIRGMSHLELALEHSGDAVEITDGASRYVYVNPGYTRLLGYTFAEVVGRTPAELHRNDYHPVEFYEQISAVLKRGETWRGIIVSRAKDGSLVHQDAAITGILGHDGLLERIVGVKRDITARRVAEQGARETAAQLHATISSLTEGVIAVDGHDVILLANPAVYTYVRHDATVGKKLGDVLHLIDQDSGDRVHDPIAALAAEDPTRPPSRFCTIDRDGNELPVMLHVNPMLAPDGEVLGAVLMLRDLTETRRVEEALAAQAAAEAVSRSKGRFLAEVSHELRTPMNGVIGMATLLDHTGLDGEQSEMLAALSRSAERMVQLIDGLLEQAGERSLPGNGSTEISWTAADWSADSWSGDGADGGTASGQSPLIAAPRVLLVDDNVINRHVARRMLGRLALSCHEANDGEDAVAAARAHAFDLILMDCQMPGMSGLEATRRIREHERMLGLRSTIIAVTANQAYDDKQHCLSAGMDDFLSKPLRFDRLVLALERWNLLPADASA